jgi:D-alanyl-lipoteichoic acid acyltransferase DltB (MBOAT superfamily)
MLFNSIAFLVFFPVVYLLYWFVFKKSLKNQNVFLFLSSYFFYGCWDWRFLFLLAFSTLLDYYSGIKIFESKSQAQKKIWLIGSVTINLGFLGVFKYYNFFAESFVEFIANFGLKTSLQTLKIILPVGISFYTFHGLSYVFDIYFERIKPTRNWINYTLFVSFFPLLVAGPIERATHLLPQVERPRNFDYKKAIDGLKQILWGLFKKVVIADNCAEYANIIFDGSYTANGSTLVIGAILFTFQIYGDFSGYSDIALGTARMLGFELLQNFNFPYFSRDIAEFWRRWHISLSSWFKDYLYIPLGGSKGNVWMKIRNTFIIFLVSGFWHGANWTFIAWGAINALFIMPSIVFNLNRNNLEIVAKGKMFPSLTEFFNILLTFGLTMLAWIFFRSNSLTQAINICKEIFSHSILLPPSIFPKTPFIFIFIFIVIEWIGRENKFAIQTIGQTWKRSTRWSFYYMLIITIVLFMGKEQQFIYFQF